MDNARINLRALLGLALLVCVVLLSLLLCGCSSASSTPDEVTNESVVLYVKNDSVLMADTETEAVYLPYVPEGGLFDENGQEIAVSDLVPGDLVRVTGNGAMAESYPAQYPGITRIDVIGFDDSLVDEYAYIISRVFPDADPAEVPTAYAEYDIEDVGNITIALDPHSYEIQTPDGEIASDGAVITEENVVLEGVPDMVITETDHVRVAFSTSISEASVMCMPTEEVAGVGLVADPDSEFSIAFDAEEDAVFFNVRTNSLYTVVIQFEAGEAAYSFIVK